MFSIQIVGGTWSDTGYRKSKIVENIVKGIERSGQFESIKVANGGYVHSLEAMANQLGGFDAVLWMPNVSNEFKKVRDIKAKYPKIMLVTSKRNLDSKYSFQDIMAHALSLKSNMVIEFDVASNSKVIRGRLLDPLGNQWHPSVDVGFTRDMGGLGCRMGQRLADLLLVRRKGTIQSPEDPDSISRTSSVDTFLKHIKSAAGTFSELIRPANGVTRFLGNASFRCERGFPSMRLGKSIYVSRRNVDKSHIGLDAFVQVGLNHNNDVWYRGPNKPSVDTPVQLALYAMMPNINWMIHSHVYVQGAPFTSNMIPCGGLQEIGEIANVMTAHDLFTSHSFAINLKGHGSIVFMNSPHSFTRYKFISRPRPEGM